MLIGLSSHEPQVGKSSIVKFLKKNHDFINTEMSDAICILADKFFGYNGDKSDTAQRKILQDIGFMGKCIDPTIWIYHALGLARRRKWGLVNDFISPSFLFHYHIQPMKDEISSKGIEEFMEGGDVVIGGIRSPSEADEIIKMGGKVYLVTRDPGHAQYAKKQHAVESELIGYDGFSGVIENKGTLEELYETVDIIIGNEKEELVYYTHYPIPINWEIPEKKEDK